jgi:Flp pilus assembly pilin Flp
VRGMAPKALPPDHLSMLTSDLWRSEEGQTMAEYGVILAVITPAIVGVLALLALTVAEHFQAIVSLI